MARPQKQTVDYFPHYANACNGDTLTVLQSRFGNDGYAFWFKLLEKLATADGHFLDCNDPIKWQLLLAKTGVNEFLGEEIMLLLVEMNAIDKELWNSRLIWCQNFVDNIADVYKNRRAKLPSRPVITERNPVTTTNNSITTSDNTQSKVKETKEKTKEKKKIKKEMQNNFELFWKAYPKKRSKGQAEKTFEKVAPDEQLFAAIMTAIEQAKKSEQWLKANGQYIPYPATWLNAKGWEDEIIQRGNGNGTHKSISRKLPETYEDPEDFRKRTNRMGAGYGNNKGLPGEA